MDSLKLIVASLFANVAGLLFPIKDDMYGLVLLFTLNFIVGMLADLGNHRSWSFKKAFCFFRDAAIYFVMVAAIYLLGHLKGEERAAVHCVSFMMYVAYYFYGTNIVRNARLLTRENSTLFSILNFLYYILSLKVVDRCDYLKDYIELYETGEKSNVV